MTSMRIGTDTSKFPGAARGGAFWTLQQVADLGLDGAFFRSPFALSATLDAGELREVADTATSLGLYLEVGTAKVNPFATPEAPEIRSLGGGDYLAGLEKIIRAVTAVGITELWTATANYQFRIPGMYACDRFRSDVDWSDQLAATAKVLDRIAPVLRDTGAHLNIETHEGITSFEVVQLVEQAGPDAFGITFDTANVVVRGEHPARAAERVAPYVRQSHVRDVALVPTEDGLGRFLAPVGRGVIDWRSVLTTLLTHAPNATLSIEGVQHTAAEMTLFVDSDVWRAAHPDLTDDELQSVIGMAQDYRDRAGSGAVPGLAALREPISDSAALAFIVDSAAALRSTIASLEPLPIGI